MATITPLLAAKAIGLNHYGSALAAQIRKGRFNFCEILVGGGGDLMAGQEIFW